MEQGVHLSIKDEVVFWVLEDYRAGKVTRGEAALKLGVSSRTVSRKAGKVRSSGLTGLHHGNRGRRPSNVLSAGLRDQVLKLMRDLYFDFNLTHAREKLLAEHALRVSYATLHGWCRKAGVGRQKGKRRPSKARVQRERMANEGLMLQMDGSHHAWNGRDKWCLIAMIDDATSDIPYAEFFEGETTIACMRVLRHVIEKKGLPDIVYTDEAGWAGGATKRHQFAQFKRACEELGIRLLTTPSPQAKGRIERAWRTCQDRLVPEFRLAKITSMLDANRYLQQVFLPAYWREQLTVEPRASTTRYRKVPERINLDQIFCLKYARQVGSDHIVNFENQRFRITDLRFGSLRKKTVMVHCHESGETQIFHGHLKLRTELVAVPKRQWVGRPA